MSNNIQNDNGDVAVVNRGVGIGLRPNKLKQLLSAQMHSEQLLSSPTLTDAWLLVRKAGLTINPEEELKKPFSLFKSWLIEQIILREYDRYLIEQQNLYLEHISYLRQLIKAALHHDAQESNVIQFPQQSGEKNIKTEATTEPLDQSQQLLSDLEAQADEIAQLRKQLALAQAQRSALFKHQRLELKMQYRNHAIELAGLLGLQGQARKDFIAKLEQRGLELPQLTASIEEYYNKHQEKGLTAEENKVYRTMRMDALNSTQNVNKMTAIMELNIIFAIRQLDVSAKEKQTLEVNVKNIVTHLRTMVDQQNNLVQKFQQVYVNSLQPVSKRIDTLAADEIVAVNRLRQNLNYLQSSPDVSKQLNSNNHFRQFMQLLPTTLLIYKFESRQHQNRVEQQANYLGLQPSMLPRPGHSSEAKKDVYLDITQPPQPGR